MRIQIPSDVVAALDTLDALHTLKTLLEGATCEEDLRAAMVSSIDLAKANYKKLALEAHPDRGGDEERMKELSSAWTIVKQIKLDRVPPPQPPPVHIVFTFGGSAFGSATSWGTGTAATGSGWANVHYTSNNGTE
jgi:hypothetical protein